MSTDSYQVIARRWRPKQFSELVGQDHVVRTLGNAINLGRIAHAYLFVGPRGTGKTSSARLFAKSLNWENGPSLEVPDDSEIGRAIMEGRCLDVIEIDGASNNSVEQVRDLRDECQYAPSQCRYKIYVIDEVHMLSQQAFNALLKTLEEPPPHVKFVFATTESHKVLPTIVSRCQRFEFRSIPAPLIVQKLGEICEVEKIEVEENALHAIARMAMGGMRDAQSILDQMISFCGKSIKQTDVLEVYGLASSEQISTLQEAVISGNYDTILKITDEFSQNGLDFYRALLDLSEHFRSLLVLSMNSSGSLVAPEQVARILDELREGETLVRSGLSEKANFEVTLFRAVEAGRTRSIDQVIRKISQILPQDSKKKTELRTLPSECKGKPSGNSGNLGFKDEDPDDSRNRAKSDSAESVDPPAQEETEGGGSVEMDGLEEGLVDDRELTKFRKDNMQPPLQTTDPEIISARIESLPPAVRKVIDEKFQGEYFAIERIDQSKLI
ncbi:MAG: DNA polymerase III subunit gamma/tau [Opitutae bacterium]